KTTTKSHYITYPNNGIYPNNVNYPNYQYGGNQYPYGGNQYPNRNGYRSNVYRRNIFYNRNNQQQQRPYNAYDIGGYGIVNQSYIPPPRRSVRQRQRGTSRQNQPRIGSNQQRRSQSRQPQQQQQQRRRRPRQLRLNDFMPTQLRDPSPTTSNLPTGFNLGTTTTTVTTAPSDALPQRQIFAATNTANNVTQPFMVNQQQQQAASTTSSTYRRRQRRGRQQQYRQISYENNNRFAELAEDNDNDDEYPVEIEENNEPMFTNRNRRDKRKKNEKLSKKTRLYLEPNRMLRWFEDNSKNSKNSVSGRGNQVYTLAIAPIYDEWVRNNYELQVCRFVQKKINRLMVSIAQASANISDLQIELTTYWIQNSIDVTAQKQAQTTAELTTNLIVERSGLGTTQTRSSIPTSTITTLASTTTKNIVRDAVDRIEKYILEYIHHCTQHVKKVAETRIQLAKSQMAEFKALEDFEQIATSSQWNIHVLLKPKMKLRSTKK
ncbi:unnamed protein product, partial [Rotaria magnacalcarata]